MPAPLPTFPLDRLSPGWAGWLDATARRLGTPVDYLVHGVFAAASGATGAGIVAEPLPGWREPMVLWLCLVGGPSSGKTPALAAARRLLLPLERALARQDERRRRDHAEATQRARVSAERWRIACAAATHRGRRVPPRPADAIAPEPFVPAQIVIGDSTLAALADVIAGNPRGVVVWRDELAAWFAALARAPGDRAAWLEAWSAAPVVLNRRSRGEPLRLERFPVSVVGAVQPERLAAALADADDGLAARFLYAVPAPAPWQPLAGRPRVRTIADDEAMAARLQHIAGLARDPARPLALRLRPAALPAFDAFCAARHREQLDAAAGGRPDGLPGGLLDGWRGKAGGMVARLAGLLALLRWSETRAAAPVIDAVSVGDAIALWSDYFLPHARRVLEGDAGTDSGAPGHPELPRALRWLRFGAANIVTRRELQREAFGRRLDAAAVSAVIAELETAGVLRALPRPARAGRPSERWQVDPAFGQKGQNGQNTMEHRHDEV